MIPLFFFAALLVIAKHVGGTNSVFFFFLQRDYSAKRKEGQVFFVCVERGREKKNTTCEFLFLSPRMATSAVSEVAGKAASLLKFGAGVYLFRDWLCEPTVVRLF